MHFNYTALSTLSTFNSTIVRILQEIINICESCTLVVIVEYGLQLKGILDV